MKKCPYCAEEIQEEAVKCRYCAEMLSKPHISYLPFEVIDSAPRRIDRWLKMKPGFNQNNVKDLLGVPLHFQNIKQYNAMIWYWEDGQVKFDYEKNIVKSWEFNVNDRPTDYHKWAAIQDNMSQLQVVAIVGNPDSVEINNNGYDEDDDWVETWQYYAYEGDMQKSCFIYFSYLTKKWINMMQGDRSVKELREKNEKLLNK